MATEAAARGLRARKKERTRELIGDTALRLFLERGFDTVTIAEIAEAAEVDVKTIYNYFPSKPDLVYHRLEAFEAGLLDAVREREPGESILNAFARFALQAQGALGDEHAGDRLRAITRMITDSETLLAHEHQVFARYTTSLTALIAEETGARATDLLPEVVAQTLIGFHRSLVDYVRRRTLEGAPNPTIARELRTQAKRALPALENGLADYGVKRK